MRAIVLREVGGPDNLELREVERPELRAGFALVRVRAAGVCHRDVIDRRGGFPFMKVPVVPGHEMAGEVVEVGDGVEDLRPGDRVVNLHRAPCGRCDYCLRGQAPRCRRALHMPGLTADGCYAEVVALPAGALLPLPEAVPFHAACFLACTAGVALRGLRERARVRPGETVLVTGASGGVGVHAVQVARLCGARVIAVTSAPDKADALAEAGADDVLIP